jgi:hypothetical protein
MPFYRIGRKRVVNLALYVETEEVQNSPKSMKISQPTGLSG